jgi:hypothetical protein
MEDRGGEELRLPSYCGPEDARAPIAREAAKGRGPDSSGPGANPRASERGSSGCLLPSPPPSFSALFFARAPRPGEGMRADGPHVARWAESTMGPCCAGGGAGGGRRARWRTERNGGGSCAAAAAGVEARGGHDRVFDTPTLAASCGVGGLRAGKMEARASRVPCLMRIETVGTGRDDPAFASCLARPVARPLVARRSPHSLSRPARPRFPWAGPSATLTAAHVAPAPPRASRRPSTRRSSPGGPSATAGPAAAAPAGAAALPPAPHHPAPPRTATSITAAAAAAAHHLGPPCPAPPAPAARACPSARRSRSSKTSRVLRPPPQRRDRP